MIIVIDGPAGSGKSSTARAVADTLGIEYLDSGALYRALSIIYISSGKNFERFFELLDKRSISFEYSDKTFSVFIDHRNVTEEIRSVQVTESVSEVASRPRSRAYVNALMRDAVEKGVYIAEGRDLGTAVFPHADLKFFMLADLDERAGRRFNELRQKGVATTLEVVKRNLRERDQIDSNRKADPLKKAADAREIDTTNLSFEQQVQEICSIITDMLEKEEFNS